MTEQDESEQDVAGPSLLAEDVIACSSVGDAVAWLRDRLLPRAKIPLELRTLHHAGETYAWSYRIVATGLTYERASRLVSYADGYLDGWIVGGSIPEHLRDAARSPEDYAHGFVAGAADSQRHEKHEAL